MLFKSILFWTFLDFTGLFFVGIFGDFYFTWNLGDRYDRVTKLMKF
jgi:hypothetical protein